MEMQRQPILFSTLHISLQLEILVEMDSKDLEIFQSCFPHYEGLVAPISTQKSYLEKISGLFFSLRNVMEPGQTLMAASAQDPTIGDKINEVFNILMVQPEVKYEPQDMLWMTKLDMAAFYDSTVAVLGDPEEWVRRLWRHHEMETLRQILDFMDPRESLLKAAKRMCSASPKHRLLSLIISFFIECGQMEPGSGYRMKPKFSNSLKTTNEKSISEWYRKIDAVETEEFRRRFNFYNKKEDVMREVLEKMGLAESYSDFFEREERLVRDLANVLAYIARVTRQNIMPAYLSMRISDVKSFYDDLRKEKWRADALEYLILEINRRPTTRVSLEMPNVPSFTMLEMSNSLSLPMLPEQQLSSIMPEIQMPTHSSTYARFIHHFPNEFKPHIVAFEDVNADGHCGFRCVAARIGLGQDGWLQVRRDLLDELNSNEHEYSSLIADFYVQQTKTALTFFEVPAPYEYWFDFESMGYMVANRYNMAVIFLAYEGSMTFLPMWSAPPETSPGTSTFEFMCIGHINQNHFIRVFLSDSPLLPAVEYRWFGNHRPIANGWKTLFDNIQSVAGRRSSVV